jgi:hypothetical protein
MQAADFGTHLTLLGSSFGNFDVISVKLGYHSKIENC